MKDVFKSLSIENTTTRNILIEDSKTGSIFEIPLEEFILELDLDEIIEEPSCISDDE